MAEIHATTRSILAWAKRAALAARRDSLTLPDLLCGLYAVREDTTVAPLLAGRAQHWADPVVSGWESAAGVDETDRKFPLDDVVRDLVRRVHDKDPALPPALLLEELLRHGEAFQRPAERALSPMLRRLDEARDLADRLVAALKERVFGQDQAIRALGEAAFHATVSPPSQGPRGVLTFLGPSGVGKTWLAECFAEELARIRGEAIGFRRFDMGTFGGPQNFEQLFGTEQFYKGSRPGTLTGFAKDTPRAVIVLDELEKAHPTTLQALLAVFDKGEVVDKALERPVDFRGTWFIVTTNLGQQLFAGPNSAGVLHAGGASPELVYDILTARGEAGAEGSTPGLPPELVSRLAKGGAVALGALETRHTLRIVGRACETASDTPSVRPSRDAAFMLLLSLLPQLDARRVAARTSTWASELVRGAHQVCRSELHAANPERLSVRVEVVGEAAAWLRARLEAPRLRVLVVDDGDDVRRLVAAELGASVEVQRATSGEAVALAQRLRPDVVLLDLCIDQPQSSAVVTGGDAVLEALRTALPWLPVVLFSENVDGRGAFESVVARVLARGGARAFIPLRRDHTDPLAAEDLVARVRAVVDDVLLDRVLREQVRAHKAVRLRTEFAWDAGATEVVARIVGVSEQVAIAAADRSASIRFAGIPTDRLDDLVGLERARRRLRQVVRWLSDPSTLEAFGARPPRGFLLAGPPGTGKTMLARALAGEAGLPFLAMSAGELQSKWVGESEERIRELFQRAQAYAPAIVFIDEIDAVAGRRGEVATHAHSVLNQLLACMDGFQVADRSVFVLAATNHPEGLDPAIRRPGRFDEVIAVERPNAAARQTFFERRLAPLDVSGADLPRLVRATAGLTPAELDRIAREAAYAAAADGRQRLEGADLLDAARLVRFGAEREDLQVRPDELRVTAWHEAGHAVAHLTLLPDDPIELLTIVPNERGALGFLASQRDEARHDLTRDRVRRQLVVALAGREAERRLGGDDALTAGARSDLEQATRLAAAAVGEWGFDEAVGPLFAPALGDPALVRRRARVWLAEAAQAAKALLDERQDLVAALAEALLERESLDGAAVAEVAAEVR
ncbi:MAG: hypothetical protein AMXMBFR64_33490 [Myxococcales bacterium]